MTTSVMKKAKKAKFPGPAEYLRHKKLSNELPGFAAKNERKSCSLIDEAKFFAKETPGPVYEPD